MPSDMYALRMSNNLFFKILLSIILLAGIAFLICGFLGYDSGYSTGSLCLCIAAMLAVRRRRSKIRPDQKTDGNPEA